MEEAGAVRQHHGTAAKPLRGHLIHYSTFSPPVQSMRCSTSISVGTSGVGHASRWASLEKLLMCPKRAPFSLAFAVLLGCAPSVEPPKDSVVEPGALSMDCPNTLTIRTSTRTTVFSMEDDGEIWFRQNWRPSVDKVVILRRFNSNQRAPVSNGS